MGEGARYGDALERDREAVLKDLRDGMRNHWAARNIYRIAYDERTLPLDAEKTRASRAEARAERLRWAKPYDAFEARWQELRPSDAVIKYKGAYPNPART